MAAGATSQRHIQTHINCCAAWNTHAGAPRRQLVSHTKLYCSLRRYTGFSPVFKPCIAWLLFILVIVLVCCYFLFILVIVLCCALDDLVLYILYIVGIDK